MSAPEARRPAVHRPADSAIPPYFADDPRDRRRLRVALAAALVAHLPLLLLPDFGSTVAAAPQEEAPVFVLRPTRFRPPPPQAPPPAPEPPPQEPAVRVPIPDPTPAEPEPLREVELPPAPEPLLSNLVFFEPDPSPAPPAPAPAPVSELRVGGAIARPERLFAPSPAYTEAARRARIEGMTILEVRLDDTGAVSDVD
ncbi:MAG TPA: hypothetical protein VHM02_12205 [Thermoanaerobaculia bacterium]|nr:hypothetical protein [Thermoanaerobaculia bacterium]